MVVNARTSCGVWVHVMDPPRPRDARDVFAELLFPPPLKVHRQSASSLAHSTAMQPNAFGPTCTQYPGPRAKKSLLRMNRGPMIACMPGQITAMGVVSVPHLSGHGRRQPLAASSLDIFTTRSAANVSPHESQL